MGYQVWAFATHLLATCLKGDSSMNLQRDLKTR